MELRCPAGKRAAVTEGGLVEVYCKSRFCGKKPGVVVLHRFRPDTGELVETLRFKAPTKPDRKGTTC